MLHAVPGTPPAPVLAPAEPLPYSRAKMLSPLRCTSGNLSSVLKLLVLWILARTAGRYLDLRNPYKKVENSTLRYEPLPPSLSVKTVKKYLEFFSVDIHPKKFKKHGLKWLKMQNKHTL